MPHLRVEYTANVQPPDASLLADLHRIVAREGGIDIENCKSRAVRLDDYAVGSGAEGPGFVHLEVRILPGRPLDVRRAVAQGCLDLLQTRMVADRMVKELQITVDVVEMQRETYLKAVR